MTKQAVQPLLADLARRGIVHFERDPDDARARRAHLTDHGWAAMLHGTGILVSLEREH